MVHAKLLNSFEDEAIGEMPDPVPVSTRAQQTM